MTSSNMKCCGSNLISLEERCCHGVGYDSYEGVCADVATASLSDTSIPPSCGSGTVCPLDRAMYAACDRSVLNFDAIIFKIYFSELMLG